MNSLWITGSPSERKVKFIFKVNSTYSKKLQEETELQNLKADKVLLQKTNVKDIRGKIILYQSR